MGAPEKRCYQRCSKRCIVSCYSISNTKHLQENDMKARMLLLTIALCFAGTALSFAQSPQLGTWKLDEAKSKIPAGMLKNSTVIYAADGDNVKVTPDGTTGEAKPLHTEWTGK